MEEPSKAIQDGDFCGSFSDLEICKRMSHLLDKVT